MDPYSVPSNPSGGGGDPSDLSSSGGLPPPVSSQHLPPGSSQHLPPGSSQHLPPGPSQSPGLLHEQHLQQLQQSIHQQQQQLHQQLTSGTSSISDLIGMLPQTASLSGGAVTSSSSLSTSATEPPPPPSQVLNSPPGLPSHMPTAAHSSHSPSPSVYRSLSQGHLGNIPPSPSTSRHVDLPQLPSQSQGQGHGETSIASIAYTRQGDSYVCSLCGKMVVSKAAIIRHIQLTHEKKKPFECNICHRRFGYKNILMEHQNIHFGIKPYACTLCDKRFAARSNLFQHRLLHMKPYCCYICNKRFDRDDQLQRHLKLHPTANILSCSQCAFTANNVEVLNNHLQENHKLMTYDTRRHSSSFDSDTTDYQSQVMSLASPTLTSPDKSPGQQDGGDPLMRRSIDSICSQLATRGSGHPHHQDGGPVKQEPLSPGVHFPPSATSSSPPPQHHHSASFPPLQGPMSPRDHLHFGNKGSPTSTMTPGMPPHSSTSSRQGQRLPPFSTALARSYSNPIDPDFALYSTSSQNMSPIPGMDSMAGKYQRSNQRFLPPTRRANSLSSINPVGTMHLGGATPERVQSMADSTSNLSEFFSTLQGLVQRSQEIPELNINISKPKVTREAGVQHNTSSLPGEPPSLEELLDYYETQGRLYRCHHCRISFEERGLYFLHKSLHGEMSPWQCSICHKLCADRNDFHLHFVNQQHHNAPPPMQSH